MTSTLASPASVSTSTCMALENVTISYGSFEAVRNVFMNIPYGKVTAFIGPSGCGKSTVLRALNRMNDLIPGCHLKGKVVFEGQDLYHPRVDPVEVRRRIGMVFQSFNLFPHMSVMRNITLALTEVLGADVDAAKTRANELLTRFGLADKAGSYPDQLSGGQQQRVAIIRALAMRPEVLLLDEITSALDPELVGEVLDAVRELKGSGITMLIATHEMAFAREISDRVCFLHAGTVAEIGAPSQMFSAPRDERTKQFLRRVMA